MKAKEKAMDYIWDNNSQSCKNGKAITYKEVEKAIDIALQEQAKEIKKEMEIRYWVLPTTIIKYQKAWDNMWKRKYGVDGGKER